jgi:hypothetical protein
MQKCLNPFILSKATETGQSSIKRSSFILYYLHPASRRIRVRSFPRLSPKISIHHHKKLQKCTCRVTLPDHRYNEALDQMGLVTLATRRQNLTNTLFKNIVNDSENKLHNLLLPVNPSEISLRGRRIFKLLILIQMDLRMILLIVIHVNT